MTVRCGVCGNVVSLCDSHNSELAALRADLAIATLDLAQRNREFEALETQLGKERAWVMECPNAKASASLRRIEGALAASRREEKP